METAQLGGKTAPLEVVLTSDTDFIDSITRQSPAGVDTDWGDTVTLKFRIGETWDAAEDVIEWEATVVGAVASWDKDEAAQAAVIAENPDRARVYLGNVAKLAGPVVIRA